VSWVTDWSEDEFIYVSALPPTGLEQTLNLRLSESGGARVDTIPFPTHERTFVVGAKAIPGSDVILYPEAVFGGAIGARRGRIIAYRRGTGDTSYVADGVIFAWSPTGHVLVGREGGFVDAVPFDPKAFRVTAPPKQVLSGVTGTPTVSFARGDPCLPGRFGQ
jgi:hypothetical protein